MWDLKSDTSELGYKTETDTENRCVVAKEGGAKGGAVKTRRKNKLLSYITGTIFNIL